MDPFTAQSLKGVLRRDLRAPLYHQLQAFLRGLIERGEIADGERLPREEELARCMGISRVTVRQALQPLADEGLLVRQRGRGTRVRGGRPGSGGHGIPMPLKVPLGELMHSLDILADHTRVRLLGWERAVPPAPVRAAFGSGADEALVRCVRVRYRHGHPFGYYASWTRTDHPDFDADNLARGSRIALFRRCGIGFSQVRQSVSAQRVGALPAMHLQMAPGQAVLTLERRAYGRDRQLLDLLEIQYRPDQLRYQMRLDHEPDLPETSA
ncbi:GntR family transcriptional regulator [Stenotrophomonas sp. MYb238]|uniref:GntR family transcriptional regulator n=1 Tax=Stenotrophomonas sp. MYb238 TaxID=2040281 RepID=UPI0031B85066